MTRTTVSPRTLTRLTLAALALAAACADPSTSAIDGPSNGPLAARKPRATVPGAGPVTWTGVNLCGAKSVVLQRDAAAGAWVDYDQ